MNAYYVTAQSTAQLQKKGFYLTNESRLSNQKNIHNRQDAHFTRDPIHQYLSSY